MIISPQEKIKGGILVRNAGLVLINNYIPKLFEYLDLMENDQFKSSNSQLDAVHYLQYVANGIPKTIESHLYLNKLLCGLQITEPINERIDIPEPHRKIISEMIMAIISQWPQIGESSVGGFMENWLIRDGILIPEDDKWKLKVEKRAYDILINQSSLSFSLIKLPWMTKPIYVEWP